MIKHTLKAGIFLATFLLSVGLVSLSILIARQERIDCELKSSTETESRIGEISKKRFDVDVRFKGYVKTENEIALDFEVSNRGRKSVFYSSYINDNSKEPSSGLPELKIGGKKVDQWRCGTGLMKFELKSGEVKVFREYANYLSLHWIKGEKVQVGYILRKGEEGDFETFWAESLPVSEELEKQMLFEQKQRN